VADPLLKKDYYQGISALDPASSHFEQTGAQQSFRRKMEQLVEELKTPDLASERKQEILEQMQLLLNQVL
jgi:hypothetical protein